MTAKQYMIWYKHLSLFYLNKDAVNLFNKHNQARLAGPVTLFVHVVCFLNKSHIDKHLNIPFLIFFIESIFWPTDTNLYQLLFSCTLNRASFCIIKVGPKIKRHSVVNTFKILWFYLENSLCPQFFSEFLPSSRKLLICSRYVGSL